MEQLEFTIITLAENTFPDPNEWSVLKKYPKYEIRMITVFPWAEIRRLKKEKLQQFFYNEKGYFKVSINDKTPKVHRIIAEQYIENPENKPTVNHKNGIKVDNRIQNLEWNTHKENANHAKDNGLNRAYLGYFSKDRSAKYKGDIHMYKGDIFIKNLKGKKDINKNNLCSSRVYNSIKTQKPYKGFTFKRQEIKNTII